MSTRALSAAALLAFALAAARLSGAEAAVDPNSTEIVFDFEGWLDGWTLGHANGARWQRTQRYNGIFGPNAGDTMMVVKPEGIHSGVVQAMSPRFKVGPGGEYAVTVQFMMKGSLQYPCYLRLRQAYDFTNYAMLPVLSFDAYGDTPDTTWHNLTAVYRGHANQPFNLVFEASLGIDNENTRIAVNRVVLQGVELAEFDHNDFFDFSNGLVGWTKGAVDGGTWAVRNHSEIENNLLIPKPTTGDNILIVERYNIHSGVMSIESPLFRIEPLQRKYVSIRFWMRGTQAYPSSLRVRAKVNTDTFSRLPFINLTPYGNVAHAQWTELEQTYEVPDFGLNYTASFQLVLEAELGGRMDNGIAIDAIGLHTLDPRPTPSP